LNKGLMALLSILNPVRHKLSIYISRISAFVIDVYAHTL
jgi:hypothetical protein